MTLHLYYINYINCINDLNLDLLLANTVAVFWVFMSSCLPSQPFLVPFITWLYFLIKKKLNLKHAASYKSWFFYSQFVHSHRTSRKSNGRLHPGVAIWNWRDKHHLRENRDMSFLDCSSQSVHRDHADILWYQTEKQTTLTLGYLLICISETSAVFMKCVFFFIRIFLLPQKVVSWLGSIVAALRDSNSNILKVSVSIKSKGNKSKEMDTLHSILRKKLYPVTL